MGTIMGKLRIIWDNPLKISLGMFYVIYTEEGFDEV